MSRWNRWWGRGPSRRAFLGGSAAAITLPWMASLQPSGALAADTPPVRLVWWYVPNGMHMPAWRPTTVGADYDLPPILAPLGDLSAHTTVLSGLSNRGGEDSRPGDHARGTAAFLTCQRPTYESVQLGQSIDQLVASSIGHHTSLASLQLGTEGGAPTGICDSGYSCAYVRNISWAGPATPLPKQTSAQAVFDRLFSGLDAGLTEGERLRRKAYRTSVLDLVRDDASALQGRLSVSDRHRLDEYLTGLRALEQRIANNDVSCAPPGRPPARIDPETNIDLLSELTVVALSCDLTRLVTFMLGNAGSNRNYGFIGASGAHHEISHHRDLQSNFDKLTTIGTWEIERFAAFLSMLKRTPEGDGSLLDHTLVMLGSEISDGNRHNHDNLPVLLAGSGGGAVSPGRHIAYDTERPLADLYISMAQAAGVSVSQFGLDGSGPLAELTG